MAVLKVFFLLSAIYLTEGQSTSADHQCVYTFNVPTSDCGKTPGPNVDDKIWKNSIIALQEQMKQIVSDMKVVKERNDKLESELKNLKKERPNTDTGVVAGSYYTHTGGGSNYLCLHRDPEWGPKTTSGFQSSGHLYGAEYEIHSNDPFSKANAPSLLDNNVPCAACHVFSRPTKLMIPARLTCPDGWTTEYTGYLMAAAYSHKARTTYVCVDNAPEVIDGGAADQDGVLFYNTEAACGSLPCPKYGDGWEVTCVVCSI